MQKMRTCKRLLATVCCAVSAGCASGSTISPPGGSPAETRASSPASEPVSADVALLTFDSAWSRINATYYDSTFRGMNWRAVGDTLRAQAAEARTLGELRATISSMLGRLGESHFAVIPQEAADAFDEDADASARPEADVGLELNWVDGELTVLRVHPGSAADAGVRAGWTVESIDGRPVAEWRDALATAETEAARHALASGTLGSANARMRGATGSTLDIHLRDGAGEDVGLELDRRPLRGEAVRFGNLPTMFAWLEHEELPLPGGGCAGIIRMNIWMTQLAQPFNRAVDELSHCAGFVLDVRGNPGGVGGMVMGTAGSFFDEVVPLAIVRSRGAELRFVANPRRVDTNGQRRETFTGPVAVLVDERSMSTSEIFAAGMQSTGRARVFGSPTPGYALPAVMLRLPTGDVLYHAVADLRDPDGRRIEGAGVVPDVPAPHTRETLLQGRDVAVEAALRWIAGQSR